jgi:hypothetical protein
MRRQLRTIGHTLGLYWQYAAIVHYGGSQAYASEVSLVQRGPREVPNRCVGASDARNLGLKQLYLRPRLAPLANVSKVTFSGFDLQLKEAKSPRALRQGRRRAALTYNSFNPDYTFSALRPVSRGWGQKSSDALGFLKSRPLRAWAKGSPHSPLFSRHIFLPDL